jgi:hypothetical protein
VVKRATISARQNERWVLPPGLARYQVIATYEEGFVVFTHPNEEPPVGTSACFDCWTYTYDRAYLCQFGNCVELYCLSCRRWKIGTGVPGCPCDDGPKGAGGCGHHTRAEQPRKKVRVK